MLKPCPCGTGINFETCCQPHLLGLEKPDSAEKLLRSRYTAFVAGEIDYICNTHHPETRKDLDRNSLKEWSKNSEWKGLEIIQSVAGKSEHENVIEFIAKYQQEGQLHKHHETSLFKRQEDQWYFFDVQKNLPIKNEDQIGRNDPCRCGSGKKFKKCCFKK
ncbi:hypothetical protein BVY03_05270 [bacterium K02(2017)]|nr:hypothetical protein BVY03_05270 [bacterium K02(2017)]